MVKIGFCGISSCGKTTMIEEVKKILGLKYRVEDVEDVRRSHPFDVGASKTFPVQFYCLSTQINLENLKGIESPEILLCDRSILDHWVFWKTYADQLERDLTLEEKERLLFYLYRFWISSYDLLIWIRVELNTVKKRFQTERFDMPSAEELSDLEDHYTRIIQEDGLQVLEVWNQQSIDECAQQIVKNISDRFLNP